MESDPPQSYIMEKKISFPSLQMQWLDNLENFTEYSERLNVVDMNIPADMTTQQLLHKQFQKISNELPLINLASVRKPRNLSRIRKSLSKTVLTERSKRNVSQAELN